MSFLQMPERTLEATALPDRTNLSGQLVLLITCKRTTFRVGINASTLSTARPATAILCFSGIHPYTFDFAIDSAFRHTHRSTRLLAQQSRAVVQ